MKVLYNTYPFAFHTPGGGEIQLLQYKKYLQQNPLLNIELFDQWKPNLSLFDRAHYFSCMPGSLHFLRILKEVGVPLLISPNLWITKKTKESFPWQEVEAQLLCADRIICNSDMECVELSSAFNINRSRFATVYNGVDEGFLTPVDRELFADKFSLNSKYVLNVANIEPRKNQLNFLTALKKFPDLQLLSVGHVRDYQYLKDCLEEGGDQFRYLGPIPHNSNELKSAYAGCEFFALPSTLETPGLAALEASAAGAKLLITSVGSTREYFKDYPEYVDPFDVDGISSGIAKLLEKPKSTALKNYIGQNFTWDRVIESLVSIYENKEVFESANVACSGMHLSEYEGDQWFVWSKLEAGLKVDSGFLSFDWRLAEPAEVSILINGKPFEGQIDITQSWSAFSVDLSGMQGEVELRISVKLISPKTSLDPRDLGVAIKNVAWSNK